MTSQEIAIYREIQKNTEMAMKAIDTISDKVYDDALAMQLSRQTLKYSEIHNAASKQLVAGKAEYYRSGAQIKHFLAVHRSPHKLMDKFKCVLFTLYLLPIGF